MATSSDFEAPKSQSLMLLSLDGGGVRGLSSLMLIKQIMELIDKDHPPKPCDVFDLIGGTSTGGLIAIMLGRLRMSVDDAIAAYMKLSPSIFTKIQHRLGITGRIQARYDSEALAKGVKEILKARGLNQDVLLKDTSEATCHTAVFATNRNTNKIETFSSYYSSRRGGDMRDKVKIWEAARATSAATSFFDAMTIDGEDFLDGGTRANNPTLLVWGEAADLFELRGPRLEENVGCLVSVGTGVSVLTAFKDRYPTELLQTLARIATETEDQVEHFQREHPDMSKGQQFFRFNVPGLQDVDLEEYLKLPEVRARTRHYIQQEVTRVQMKSCTERLQMREREIIRSLNYSLNAQARYLQLSIEQESRTEYTRFEHHIDWILHTNAFESWTHSNPAYLYCADESAFVMSDFHPLAMESVLKRALLAAVPQRDSITSAKSPVEELILYCSSTNIVPDLPTLAGFSTEVTPLLWQLFAQLLPDGCTWRSRIHLRDQWARDQPHKTLANGNWTYLIDQVNQYQASLDRFPKHIIVLYSLNDSIYNVLGEFKQACIRISSVEKLIVFGSCKAMIPKSEFLIITPLTEYQECKEALRFDDIHTRRDQVAYAKGRSNRWITSHPSFKSWLRQQASVLWIQGKPGSGKSVLAKTVLNKALADGDYPVADWFYSIRGGKIGMAHSSMLRSISYELLTQDQSLYQSCKSIYRKNRKYRRYSLDASSWPIKSLQDLVASIICAPQGAPIMLVLDGLDESEKDTQTSQIRTDTMKFLRELVQLDGARLKVIALSRPSPDIEEKFGDFHHIIMQHANKQDIDEIVEIGLRELKEEMLPTHLRERRTWRYSRSDFLPSDASPNYDADEVSRTLGDIQRYLVDHAEGVVLWVLLILQEMQNFVATGRRERRLYTLDQVLDRLYVLPLDIMDLYASIVKDLTQNKEEEDIRVSRQILEWVIGVSVVRPLCLVELYEALAIPEQLEMTDALSSQKDPIEKRRKHVADWTDFRMKIYSYCGPFIEVRAIQPLSSVSNEALFAARRAIPVESVQLTLDPSNSNQLPPETHQTPRFSFDRATIFMFVWTFSVLNWFANVATGVLRVIEWNKIRLPPTQNVSVYDIPRSRNSDPERRSSWGDDPSETQTQTEEAHNEESRLMGFHGGWGYESAPDDTVMLLHQTAREFLSSSESAGRLLIDIRQAEDMVPAALQRYLMLTFPPNNTPWATNPLCRETSDTEGIQKMVERLQRRSLLDLVDLILWKTKRPSLTEHIIGSRYAENEIEEQVAKYRGHSTTNFLRVCAGIHQTLLTTRKAWLSTRSLLRESPLRTAHKGSIIFLLSIADDGLREAQKMLEFYWNTKRSWVAKGPLRYCFRDQNIRSGMIPSDFLLGVDTNPVPRTVLLSEIALILGRASERKQAIVTNAEGHQSLTQTRSRDRLVLNANGRLPLDTPLSNCVWLLPTPLPVLPSFRVVALCILDMIKTSRRLVEIQTLNRGQDPFTLTMLGLTFHWLHQGQVVRVTVGGELTLSAVREPTKSTPQSQLAGLNSSQARPTRTVQGIRFCDLNPERVMWHEESARNRAVKRVALILLAKAVRKRRARQRWREAVNFIVHGTKHVLNSRMVTELVRSRRKYMPVPRDPPVR